MFVPISALTPYIRNIWLQSFPFVSEKKKKKKYVLCESPNAAINYFCTDCCACIHYRTFSPNSAPSDFQFCGSLKNFGQNL
jgi:hypothetical protein